MARRQQQTAKDRARAEAERLEHVRRLNAARKRRQRERRLEALSIEVRPS